MNVNIILVKCSTHIDHKHRLEVSASLAKISMHKPSPPFPGGLKLLKEALVVHLLPVTIIS